MISTGVKTETSDQLVTDTFLNDHLLIGIDSLKQLIENRQTVKHLRF
jgi:AMP nucleosidase